jgi:hypothetical protein
LGQLPRILVVNEQLCWHWHSRAPRVVHLSLRPRAVRPQRRPRPRDQGLELFSRIVWGDSCAGDLEREAVRRRLPVHLAVVGRSKRSSKLLEDTALVSRVLGILMDRAGFVEVTSAASTIWCLWSRFDLDLAIHVAGCYVSCVLQAKRHAG